MTYKLSLLFLFLLFQFSSCNTSKLKTITRVDSDLKELSAIETIPNSELLWSIQDSGNTNALYGLDTQGTIIKNVTITNVKNRDWEDLTTDNKGNFYIGDFGNNNKKHKVFYIYKVSNLDNESNKAIAEIISFKLPKKMKAKNFEAFFLWKENFYLFSKDAKKVTLIKIPNRIGKHTAELITSFNLKGKKTLITASDISEDGKKIVLLCHDKLILLSDFKSDNFFEGKIDYFDFGHDSQKEGICFKNNTTVLINDEHAHLKGGYIYEFSLFQ